ncbi:MAG TPA: 4a-hydroxytetrahydrobiopterin dehydratase [Longimicrobiaceae bacterium]|nr:4a-hydroxytetrahydrobiopterin dehydratase [Longimicrobiaceae bacterium]
MSNALSEQEIRDRLAAQLPSWRYEDGHLTRVFETGGWQRTLLLANAIGYLGEAAWHHPDLLLTYPRLKVMLTTHDAGGITGKDFELALRIEEVATWQPAEGSALTGPEGGWFV